MPCLNSKVFIDLSACTHPLCCLPGSHPPNSKCWVRILLWPLLSVWWVSLVSSAYHVRFTLEKLHKMWKWIMELGHDHSPSSIRGFPLSLSFPPPRVRRWRGSAFQAEVSVPSTMHDQKCIFMKKFCSIHELQSCVSQPNSEITWKSRTTAVEAADVI